MKNTNVTFLLKDEVVNLIRLEELAEKKAEDEEVSKKLIMIYAVIVIRNLLKYVHVIKIH